MVLCSVPSPITCLTRGADLLEDLQVVLCPPGCAQWRMSVFGTGPYASISNVCGAAIHRYTCLPALNLSVFCLPV